MTTNNIRTIGIVGAGTMGSQIALQCAVFNYTVNLYDISKDILDNSKTRITRMLGERTASQEIPFDTAPNILSKINFFTDLKESLASADFVIEAVFERLDAKRQVFRQIDELCPPSIVIASNTSSIKSSEFANETKRPSRVIDVNFSNPVWAHPMVEIMGNQLTSTKTVETTEQLARSIGMTPIIVKKENTGYAFNRVWRAIKKESLRLVDQDYVSFEDVDRAFIIGLGASVGPFMLMDMIGLDVVKAIEEQYFRESGDPSDKPPQLLVTMVEKGELGVKANKGFYTYPDPNYKKPDWLKGK
jgi:3-hydroxybutyryl-CoA dehydrogenase